MTAKKPTTPTKGGDLLTKAMLVKFSSSCWGAKKNDREVAQEVADKHKSDANMGKFTKVLLASEHREAYKKVAREAYTYHRTNTLPWDEGTGLLPAAKFWKYNEEMERLKREAETHAEAFAAEYQKQWSNGLSDYQKALGDLFDENDYPEPKHIRAKFGIKIRVSAITNPDDFRVQLGTGGTEKIRKQMLEDMKTDLQEAMKEPYRRLFKAISKIHDRISDADAKFRDSLIDNAKELVEILPDLNVTNDPELTKLIAAVRKELCVDDVDALRKDKKYRSEVAKSAAEILKGMQGYVT